MGCVILAAVEAVPRFEDDFLRCSRMSEGALGLLEGNSCLAKGFRGGGWSASNFLLALANMESTAELNA